MGQAKPCVGMRLGAPRRLLISRQGRTGAGRVGSEAGGQQAGHESGCPRFQQPRGFGRNRWAILARQVGTPGDDEPGDADQPQDQQGAGRGGHEGAPCMRLLGYQSDRSKDSEGRQTCQGVTLKRGIIHHRVWEYQMVVLPLDIVDNSTSPGERISGSLFSHSTGQVGCFILWAFHSYLCFHLHQAAHGHCARRLQVSCTLTV
jgi:hypothetical protein